MLRPLSTLLLCLLTAPLWAQDESLTDEFARMSAKERTRIAKKEVQEAEQDARYQEVMEQAETLFREQRYEEALELYQEARTLRPYNVYPKVKIQDLKVLIRQRDAAPGSEDRGPEKGTTGPPPAPSPVAGEERSAPTGTPATPVVVARTVPTTPPEHPPTRNIGSMERTPPAVRNEPVAPPVEGERIFREGRAVVVERVVVEEGRPLVWRKVFQPWGEVVHFRDGVAVPQRAWVEAFGPE